MTNHTFPNHEDCEIIKILDNSVFVSDDDRILELPTDPGTITERDSNDPELQTTICTIGGLRVAVKRFEDLEKDFKNSQYAATTRARRVAEKGAKELGEDKPPLWIVQHVLAGLLDDVYDGEFPGKKPEKWAIGASLAHGELFRHRACADFKAWFEHEKAHPAHMSARRRRLLDFVKVEYRSDRDNKQHQLRVDEMISERCVNNFRNFDILFCTDKNHEILMSVVIEAQQKVYGEKVTAAIDRAMADFSYLYPLNKPDHRHESNRDQHLPENPGLDVDSPECPDMHTAVCGVGHFGTARAIGRTAFKDICLRKFSQSGRPTKMDQTHAWDQFLTRVLPGPVRFMHELGASMLKRIDPKHYADCVAVNNGVPNDKKFSIMTDDPAGFDAYLHGPLTERHLDTSDWEGGLAGLITFGEFSGMRPKCCSSCELGTNIDIGGDLITPELELRVPFPPGSMAHLRGSGLTHYTMKHYGIDGRPSQRKTLVMTNHESVRRAVEKKTEGASRGGTSTAGENS